MSSLPAPPKGAGWEAVEPIWSSDFAKLGELETSESGLQECVAYLWWCYRCFCQHVGEAVPGKEVPDTRAMPTLAEDKAVEILCALWH